MLSWRYATLTIARRVSSPPLRAGMVADHYTNPGSASRLRPCLARVIRFGLPRKSLPRATANHASQARRCARKRDRKGDRSPRPRSARRYAHRFLSTKPQTNTPRHFCTPVGALCLSSPRRSSTWHRLGAPPRQCNEATFPSHAGAHPERRDRTSEDPDQCPRNA